MKKRKIIFLVLFILFTFYIFSNSMMPAEESGKQGGRIIKFLTYLFSCDSNTATLIVRKSAHFLEFFVQGALFSGIIFESFKKNYIYLLFFGLLTAVTDEFIQNFSEGRGSMVSDCLIDFSGTLAITVIVFIIWYFKKKRVN